MSREREKILKMVADGTITPDEAERLLNRLDAPATATVSQRPRSASASTGR